MVSLPSGEGCCAGCPGALTAPTRHSRSALRETAELQRYARPCSAPLGPRSGPLRRPALGPAGAAPARLAAVAVRSFLAPWLGLSARASPVARGRGPLPPPPAAAVGPSPAGLFCGPPGSGRARGLAAPLGLSGLPVRSPCGPLRAGCAPVWPGRVPPLPPPAGPLRRPLGRLRRPRSSRPGGGGGPMARLVAAMPPPGVGVGA